uniref:Candidate secreted effector n=1 Tax=Meloidogyne incognita TaxID=6306 RepID=A0A914NVZ0_MELIC
MNDGDGGLSDTVGLYLGQFQLPFTPPPSSHFADKACCVLIQQHSLFFFHSVLCMLCNQRSCCIWTSSICSRGGCGALFSNIKSTSPLWHVACVL